METCSLGNRPEALPSFTQQGKEVECICMGAHSPQYSCKVRMAGTLQLDLHCSAHSQMPEHTSTA